MESIFGFDFGNPKTKENVKKAIFDDIRVEKKVLNICIFLQHHGQNESLF
jgi:hypothetical protein